ncbi:MAG: DUF4167 domain-containing protein [Paracoccaceae bacterium]|nr:DUF4167 domain-containing protein [Paracoccaceae bacterium]
MRSTKTRSRSKSNRNRSVGNVVNRVFDSSGPEGKVRGTPQQIIEKYNQLARDAHLGNDRVAAENFQQHAEHYLRLLSEAQRNEDQRREQQDRESRERQSERDRERAGRDASRSPSEQPAFDPAAVPQPDVFEMSVSDLDNGLVETPESSQKSGMEVVETELSGQPGLDEASTKVAKPRPARKPRKKPAAKEQPVVIAEPSAVAPTPAGDTPSDENPATAAE